MRSSCATDISEGCAHDHRRAAHGSGQPGRRREQQAGQPPAALDTPIKIDVEGLNFYYGTKRALDGITIQIRQNIVTAFIGPSGCGKSTFLRTLNRMNDIIPATRVEGKVLIDGNADL